MMYVSMLAAVLSLDAMAADNEPKGYLVFGIDRFVYLGSDTKGMETKQEVKVPLTAEFMANFKNLGNQTRMGTGFYCLNARLDGNGGTGFAWNIHKTNPYDNRWAITVWADGGEEINGARATARNPSVQENFVVRNLEDIEMNHMVSYSGGLNPRGGVNVSFSVKYVSADDHKTLDSIPAAEVKKANGKVLFKGGDAASSSGHMSFSFQED